MSKPLIVDAHEDLAYNALILGRDYSRSIGEIRRLEQGSSFIAERDNTLLGWPEYQKGQVALIFSTLFALPAAHQSEISRKASYQDFNEARQVCLRQMDIYLRLVDKHPDKFDLIRTAPDLDMLLTKWRNPENESAHPVGLVILMEGAEGIRTPDELEEWWSLGLRIIGPAWTGTRYCGGWLVPGPLTDDGRELLKKMADFNFTLDLSHMDEEAALQSLELYPGPIIASHSNVNALLPNVPGNRHLSDRVIQGLIERGGVIGVVPFNEFLQSNWKKQDGRQDISLTHLVAHIDYICQMAGDARHVGLGTDFDGGFGLESVPAELDSIADLQKLSPLLAARGYSETDVTAILGENFINHLKNSLPAP